MQLTDQSVSNGSMVLRITQTLMNAETGVRACTALATQAMRYCVNDSEFRVIGGSGDDWRYNNVTHSYSADFSVQGAGWPHAEYISRYITSNGERYEFRFTPRIVQSNQPAPTPAPAPAPSTPAPAPSTGSGSGSTDISGGGDWPLHFYDYSTSDGTKVLRVTQRFVGAKKYAGSPVLRGCTVTAAQAGTYCKSDSEFRTIGGAGDTWKYDAATDTYSVDMDVSAYNWPQTVYFTRYIFANGSRGEFSWAPRKR